MSSNSSATSHLLDGVQCRRTSETNHTFLEQYTTGEVLHALKGMGPTKAPSEDGFPAIFFQKYWHIIGNEVSAFCLEVLNNGKEVSSINNTHIVLLPKINNPMNLANFKPISLYNLIYKLIFKVIAYRFQHVLEDCIDKSQSAFILRRLISDNVLLAYEILYSFLQKQTGMRGLMAIKLDMSKAYDRVKWDFLKQMMFRLGFDEEWVNLIMWCIMSFSYYAKKGFETR